MAWEVDTTPEGQFSSVILLWKLLATSVLSIYVDTAHAPIKSFLPPFYPHVISFTRPSSLLFFFFYFFFSSRAILYLFFVRDYTSERGRPGDEANNMQHLNTSK